MTEEELILLDEWYETEYLRILEEEYEIENYHEFN